MMELKFNDDGELELLMKDEGLSKYVNDKYDRKDIVNFVSKLANRNLNIALITNTIDTMNMAVTEKLLFNSFNGSHDSLDDITKAMVEFRTKYKFIHISQNKKIYDMFSMNLRYLQNLVDYKISTAMFEGDINKELNGKIKFMEIIIDLRNKYPIIFNVKTKHDKDMCKTQ